MPILPYAVERMIEAARERGEFDGLPGLGKPIPDLDVPHDEMWWVRKWLEREELDPAAELRAEGGCPAIEALLAKADGRRGARGR